MSALRHPTMTSIWGSWICRWLTSRAARSTTAESSPELLRRQAMLTTTSLACQETSYPRQELSIFNLTFPHIKVHPLRGQQLKPLRVISRLITIPLFQPKLRVAFGQSASDRTVMAMPEAAVDEDHLSTTRKDQVWFSGQTAIVKPISEPFPMQQSSQ